ncbi:MAG: hypothetical protein NTX11_00815 [Candidatus Saccharibacteria bacterium]|nr:hypothetical protein [Candidatus Saccharibacteria bacterium]
MAALAESYVQCSPLDFDLWESELTQSQDIIEKTDDSWMLASHEFPELWSSASAKATKFLGSLSMRGQVEVSHVPEHVSDTTLLAGIQSARHGDAHSLSMVKTNVMTDVSERLYKVAHQSKVALQFEQGKLIQNNRHLIDIHRNTFENMTLNSVMRKRSEHELRNAYMFEELHEAGVLQTHAALVFSCAPKDEATLRDYGFYADTASCSIQMLRADGSSAILETAMVAGKKTPHGIRHDEATIKALASDEDIDLLPSDSDDMLQFIMLVPKSEIPNGMSDIIRRYDQKAGGTFYGQDAPSQDYLAYAEICHQRDAQFMPMVESITNQLLHEAAGFKNPIDAIKRLDELSERYCVDKGIEDKSIDVAVFGAEAAFHIQQARDFMARGEYYLASQSALQAKQTATSSSCPFFRNANSDPSSGEDSGSGAQSEKKWMNCPYCAAKVFGDPCATKLSCWDCKAAVVNGKVVSIGDGGRAKRRENKKRDLKPQVNSEYALAE